MKLEISENVIVMVERRGQSVSLRFKPDGAMIEVRHNQRRASSSKHAVWQELLAASDDLLNRLIERASIEVDDLARTGIPGFWSMLDQPSCHIRPEPPPPQAVDVSGDLLALRSLAGRDDNPYTNSANALARVVMKLWEREHGVQS